jgi:hypothetical protein
MLVGNFYLLLFSGSFLSWDFCSLLLFGILPFFNINPINTPSVHIIPAIVVIKPLNSDKVEVEEWKISPIYSWNGLGGEIVKWKAPCETVVSILVLL